MRRDIPAYLGLPLMVGLLLTLAFVAACVGFVWVDGDAERLLVCAGFEVLAGPLFVGAIQAIRGKRSGAKLLRFGSPLFVFQPDFMLALWNIESDAWYAAYLSDRSK